MGAPCTGKSTFASKYVLEHSWVSFHLIDEYRITYKDEALAWKELNKAIEKEYYYNHISIVESTGLDWRLSLILYWARTGKVPVRTILLTANHRLLYERLRDRHHKRPLPPQFKEEDEYLSIDYTLEHQHEVNYRIDYQLDVTNLSAEQVYKSLSNYIAQERLEIILRTGEKNE